MEEQKAKKRKMVLSAILQLVDSDSDDELIVTTVCNFMKKQPKTPRLAVKNYVENVASLYNHDDFKSHFRLERSTFEYLLETIGPFLVEKNANGVGPHTYPPKTQLLVALSMLSNQEVYRITAEKFDVSKSTAWLYVQKVCTILVHLSGNYISWPTGQKAQRVIEDFKTRQGFPGVLGAVDGTHIPITSPLKQQAAYCNRHHYHSIILQGVCDANYMFTDVFTGYPGSVHDARVFKNSPLGKKINAEPLEVFPDNNCHILGDSAYKCTNYVLTPYRDNGHITRKQRNFNYKLSSTRVVIEQCYGLLKGRFRILKHVNVYNTEFIPKLIIACCVLHNICMAKHDSIDITDDMVDNNEPEEMCSDNDAMGTTKRNFIADQVFIT